MYHRSFFTDAYNLPALGRVRPDLRTQGVRDWATIPVEPGYVFRSVGPATGIEEPGSPRRDSGLVSAIAVGSDPNHLMIGTRAGGIWGTTDEGQNWTALGDSLPSLQTMVVARFDESGQPPLVIAGSGDANEAGARDPGLVGVFRSIDGGKTWSILDAGMFGTHFRSHDINNVVLLDRNRLFVSTRLGLFFSKDAGRNFGDDADFKNGRPLIDGHITDIVIDGTKVAVAVAGDPPDVEDPPPTEVIEQARTSTATPGLYVSELTATGINAFGSVVRATQTAASADEPSKTVLGHHGAFWVMSASKLDALAHSLAGPRPSTIHSVHLTRRDPLTPSGWGMLNASERSGLNAFQTTYCHTVAIEPTASTSVFNGWFGSVHLMRTNANVSSGSWVWSSTERGTMDDVHADIHIVRVDDLPGPSRRILVGNDGGFTVSRNAGVTWASRNTHASCLFWTVSFARVSATRARMICGVQDNGTVIGEGPFEPASPSDWTWKRTGPGDGGANAFIPNDRDHFANDNPAAAYITANGILLRASPTPGPEWEFVLDPHGETTPLGFIYSETVAVARSASGEWDRLFFGNSATRNGPGILRTRDGASSTPFTVRSPPAPHAGANGEFPAMITALAVAPRNPRSDRNSPGAWDLVWVGLANGQVWFSRDAGANFSQITVGGGGFPVAAIAIDPDDSDRVAIGYGGFNESPLNGPTRHVFLTENGGANFRDISGRRGTNGFVPDLPVLSACFTRTNPPALLIGTDIGVLVTKGPNFGERWTRLGANMPKAPCSQLTVLNDLTAPDAPPLSDGLPPAAVATFGRGAFLLVRPSNAEAFIEFDGGFGAMAVNETRSHTATLHNVGNASLTLGTPTFAAPFSATGLPTGTLAARSQATFTVPCRPTAAGSFIADFTLGGITIPVSCEAFSDGPPRLAMHPRQIVFGDVPDGQTVEEAVHLQNLGQSELRITGIQAVGSPSSAFEFSPAIPPEVVLAPGEERTLSLRFRASGVNSDHRGTWRISSNDPIADQSHFQVVARAHVTTALPDQGLPGWVPWAIAGGVVVLVGVGVGVYFATRDDEEEESTSPPPSP
ncbi:MAG: choice-of-anchor D domain-containing protein [Myxococcota bacterium]